MPANMPNRCGQRATSRSIRFTPAKHQPGTSVRSETPPDSMYRNGIAGPAVEIAAIRHAGNRRSNCARSRSNTIHGSAPLAPLSGPSPAMRQSAAPRLEGLVVQPLVDERRPAADPGLDHRDHAARPDHPLRLAEEAPTASGT